MSELNEVIVAQESDMPAIAEHPGMLSDHLRITHIIQVTVHDDSAVQHNFDAAPPRGDFISIPSSDLCPSIGSGDNAVDRPILLPRLNIGVFRRLIIEHLDLHPKRRRLTLQWRANSNTVVTARLQFEFQSQDEIRKFPLRE